MEISSLSGMQVGMSLGSIRRSSSDDTESFATEMSTKFLQDNDADGDGLVSAAECSEDEDFFNSIDEDGDGFLSQDELLNDAKAKLAEMQNSFGTGDMNGVSLSSTLSGDESDDTAEASEAQASGSGSGSSSGSSGDSTTDAIDTNGDGVISQEELLAYLQATMGPMAAESASGATSLSDEQLLEQTTASSDSLNGIRGRAADAYGSMQQAMFGESQDASSYTYDQSIQESLSMTV